MMMMRVKNDDDDDGGENDDEIMMTKIPLSQKQNVKSPRRSLHHKISAALEKKLSRSNDSS